MSTNITPRGNLANPMPEKTKAPNQLDTALFLVRLWQVGIVANEGATDGDSGKEVVRHYHGKVQHVIRGEAHTFTDWATMTRCLEDMMLREPARAAQEEGTDIDDK